VARRGVTGSGSTFGEKEERRMCGRRSVTGAVRGGRMEEVRRRSNTYSPEKARCGSREIAME
jgi:hypothetical protein